MQPTTISIMHTPAPAAAQPIWKSQNTHLPLFKARMNPPTSNPPFVYRQYVCYCWLGVCSVRPKTGFDSQTESLNLIFSWYIFWLLSFLFVVVTHQWSNPLRLLPQRSLGHLERVNENADIPPQRIAYICIQPPHIQPSVRIPAVRVLTISKVRLWVTCTNLGSTPRRRITYAFHRFFALELLFLFVGQ